MPLPVFLVPLTLPAAPLAVVLLRFSVAPLVAPAVLDAPPVVVAPLPVVVLPPAVLLRLPEAISISSRGARWRVVSAIPLLPVSPMAEREVEERLLLFSALSFRRLTARLVRRSS